MITLSNVIEGTLLHFENEMLPALSTGKQFAVGTFLGMCRARPDILSALIEKSPLLSGCLDFLAALEKDGELPIDDAANAAKEAMRKYAKDKKLPLDIPGIDVVFYITEKDIERLRGYIEQAAGQ